MLMFCLQNVTTQKVKGLFCVVCMKLKLLSLNKTTQCVIATRLFLNYLMNILQTQPCFPCHT
ncbi:UNVERIFIED_CONTAM: hypothetical protein NCL1_53559 [Trichonephila clavipes]